MIKKIFLLCVILITCSSCSEFALIASGSSLAVSQNVYARTYSGIDVLAIIQTEKDIKKHIYDTIKTDKKRNRNFKENY
jgi:hypothetical protein